MESEYIDPANPNVGPPKLLMAEHPAETAARTLLKALWPGYFDAASPDSLTGQHLIDTPGRFARMLTELTTPEDINWRTFKSLSDEMVIVEGINFVSLCSHHIVPYMGAAHVAYIPNNQICGLSKIARVVRHYAADLTVQEELTSTIAHFLREKLEPFGVAVVMKAEHLCMSIRGVQAPGTKTTTSCMLGAFADHERLARTEFLNLISRNGG